MPVIASLNGMTPGGWLRYARLIEQAGADAPRAEHLSRRHRPEHERRRASSGRRIEVVARSSEACASRSR